MGYPTPKPITVYASAARTATPTATVYKVDGGVDGRGLYRGLCILIDVTAIAATPSVVFSLQTAGGPEAMVELIASAAVVATGTTRIIVHPSVPTEVANLTDQGPLETKWRLVATHADADSITYSVIAFPLP